MKNTVCNLCLEEVCCCQEIFNDEAADLYGDFWRMFEALDSSREDRSASSDDLDEIIALMSRKAPCPVGQGIDR